MVSYRSALPIFVASLALNFAIPMGGHAQGLQDFGLVGQSQILNKIREITDPAEAKRIEDTRVCNRIVAWAGGVKKAADAMEQDWKNTLASYQLRESDSSRRQTFDEPLIRPSDAEGKKKYVKERQSGTSERTMQLFAYAFYIRAMHRNRKYVDTVSTADRPQITTTTFACRSTSSLLVFSEAFPRGRFTLTRCQIERDRSSEL